MGDWSRRRVLLAVAATVALGLTACSNDGSSPLSDGSVGGPSGKTEEKRPAKVMLEPAAGTADVSPVAPVKVSVTDGTIESLTLTNPTGKQVIGQLTADGKTWTVGEPLGYGKTYTWAGTAKGTNGKSTAIEGAFTTVTPDHVVDGSINTGDGNTYGIAMPIAITFDADVEDKATAQKALTVQTSVPTEGAWAWLDDRTVHWRPQAYWQPGTQVTVSAKLYGISFGGGAFGNNDLTSSFTIGRSQVVKADTQTHRVVVITDGVQTADYPASFGLETDPGRVTNSGTHIVMSKHETYSMTNPKYNYENVVVPWAVRISNNGEFIHGYAPSMWAQGKQNVSHGCLNLSPANAKLYYDTVLTGDPVEISGSTQQLGPEDGDYYDWALTWDQWLAKSAIAG